MKNKENSLAEKVGEELKSIEKLFQLLLQAYNERFQSELRGIQAAVQELGGYRKIAQVPMEDLRDMLMLIRQLEIKPAKGRRKDLKKLEALLKDLQGFARDWETTKVIQPVREALAKKSSARTGSSRRLSGFG